MIIPALTLWQPWASLVAGGFKAWETRSWRPRTLEPPFWIAIHSAKREPLWISTLFNGTATGRKTLECLGPDWDKPPNQLPRGQILALALVGGFYPTEDVHHWLTSPEHPAYDPIDVELGDYTPGRWGWEFRQVEPLPTPIPARGRTGLWRWELPKSLDVFAIHLEVKPWK